MTGFSVHPETCRRIPLIASSAKHFRYGNVRVATFSPRRREVHEDFRIQDSATQNAEPLERLEPSKRLNKISFLNGLNGAQQLNVLNDFKSSVWRLVRAGAYRCRARQ